jgi:hypothetical protein
MSFRSQIDGPVFDPLLGLVREGLSRVGAHVALLKLQPMPTSPEFR